MNSELIHLYLPSESIGETPRECHMSEELFRNARMTMGELRDFLSHTGISWDFILHQVELADRPLSPLDKALRSMDPYTTGPGKSLRDLPSNVW